MPDFEPVILALTGLAHYSDPDPARCQAVLQSALDLPADNEVIAGFVSLGDAALITEYLAEKRNSPEWEKVIKPPRSHRLMHVIAGAARHGQQDVILALHQGGVPLHGFCNSLFRSACGGGHAQLALWLGKQFWSGVLPFTLISSLIGQCGSSLPAGMAPTLSLFLKQKIQSGEIDTRLLRTAIAISSPKIFSALLLAGPSPASLAPLAERWPGHRRSPQMDARIACARLAASNHGKLKLFELEPDLCALIARPEEEAFLGLGRLPA